MASNNNLQTAKQARAASRERRLWARERRLAEREQWFADLAERVETLERRMRKVRAAVVFCRPCQCQLDAVAEVYDALFNVRRYGLHVSGALADHKHSFFDVRLLGALFDFGHLVEFASRTQPLDTRL